MYVYVSVCSLRCVRCHVNKFKSMRKQMNLQSSRERRKKLQMGGTEKQNSPLVSFDANNARSMQIKSIWSLEILCN